MKLLKKIGIILTCLGFLLLFFQIYMKKFGNMVILCFLLLSLGTIFQLPAQYHYVKTRRDVNLQDRKYFVGLILGSFIFPCLIIFFIKSFYF